jgi:hypothetical protein
LAQKPEHRDESRQAPKAATQDGPGEDGAARSPALLGIATEAEKQGALEDEQNAETPWLSSVVTNLRSFLGIAALLVFVLPAVVLVLTMLGDDNKPVSMNTATARGGGSAINSQDQPEGGEQRGNGEVSHPLLGRHDRSSGTSSEDDGEGPTRRTVPDQRDAHQAQDATVVAGTATPTAAAAGSPEPVSSVAASSASATEPVEGNVEAPTSSTPPVPPDTPTGPTTATKPTSAPAEAASPITQQASSSDPSAPAIAGAMPTPGDIPVEDFQGHVSDTSVYDPSE